MSNCSDLIAMDDAVSISNVHKRFDIKSCNNSSKTVINALNGISLTVKTNTIYGLLGPSGSGKTTLLKAILGQLHIDKGHIEIMGVSPGHALSTIPGPGAGYMPQEMALFKEFSINETLFYFGRIFKMKRNQIQEKQKFLLDLLDLPRKDRIIRNLSGGQQRRVSFAVALLHDPPLLILDEPTVGVDPLLRQKIWAHMISLTQSGKSTVIITTHYIEEARRADKVGFMRHGEILADDEPEKIIARYSMPTLEDVFLKLCSEKEQTPDIDCAASDGDKLLANGDNNKNAFPLVERNQSKSTVEVKDEPCFSCKNFSLSGYFCWWRFFACFVKGFIVLKRNPGYLIFQFFLPFIQTFLFCYCIGMPPYNLNVGFVNEDVGSYGDMFVSSLNNRTLKLIDYGNSSHKAIGDVENLKLWAYLHIRQNFSSALDKKLNPFSKLDNATLASSNIYIHADSTDLQVGMEINKTLLMALKDFLLPIIQSKMKSLIPDVDERLNLPLDSSRSVYGQAEASYTDFMIPGILHTIMYFLATGMTAMTIITERREGLLGRSFISGVTFFEILIANSTLQFFILLVQVIILLMCALLIFEVENLGSTILLGCSLLLSGYSGMCYGYFISSICDSEIAAIQLAIGSMYPCIVLNGVIWPLEGMPMWLQSIVKCLPLSYAIIAMRSIMLRGFGLLNSYVLMGFGVMSVWSFAFFVLCLLVLTVRRNFCGLTT